jgi:sugar fermentation stimulation protein A
MITDASRHAIRWPRLLRGVLVRRYQRFKADVKLRNGHVVTALCPNSGSMKTCCEPGRAVFISRSHNPKRKLKYTWEMIRMPGSLVGINTNVPNKLVKESILRGDIPELTRYERIRTEIRYGVNSRIDILLEGPAEELCFVEVKNCTLVEDGVATFPDAVTARGRKHLVELANEVRKGHRSVNLYLVQRMDAEIFRPADSIDPAYGEELRRAVDSGVEALVYDVSLDTEGISLNKRLPCRL